MADYVRSYLDASAATTALRYCAWSPDDEVLRHGARGDPVPVLMFHPAGGSTSAYEAC